MSEEGRSYDRLQMDNVVRLREYDLVGGGDTIESSIKDVSGGGVLLSSENFFDVGTLLELKLNIPGWSRHKTEFLKIDWQSTPEPLVTLGRVVRVERCRDGSYDVGVVFECIDDDHRDAVAKYVESVKIGLN